MKKILSTILLLGILANAVIPTSLVHASDPGIPQQSIHIAAIIPDTMNPVEVPTFTITQDLSLPNKIVNYILNALRITGPLKHIKVINPNGAIVLDEPFVDTNANIRLPLTSFVPGKYDVKVDDQHIDSFSWGVLAMNPDKSIYKAGESADLSMAVLDAKGMMVCDANVTLTIKDPTNQETMLSTGNHTITVNDSCMKPAATTIPDYQATYQTTTPGTYHLTLTAETADGTHTIQDAFTAESQPEFSIQRKMATRLYPVSLYTAQILVTPDKDFDGTLTETVSSAFGISKPANDAHAYTSVTTHDSLQYISWNVSLRKGQTQILEYVFDPPDSSPDFFLAGPVRIKNSWGITTFTETRRWQMANDAPSDYSFQRKTWYDGTRYWRSYNDTANSRIRFDYSTDGVTWTENTSARIAVNTNDFSVRADASTAYISYTNGFDIEVRSATSYPGTGFAWSAATIAYDGTSGTDFYQYPTIALDTNSRIWLGSSRTNGSTYTFNAERSTNVSDITTWDAATALNSSSNANKYGVIVPRLTANMQAIYIDGTTISSKNYTGGAWDSSATFIETGKSGLTTTIAATGDAAGNVHAAYIDSNGYTYYREYTTSWQPEVKLDANVTNTYPSISYDTTSTDVYVFWIRSNTIYYSQGQSSYTLSKWSTNPTQWKSGTSLSSISTNYSFAGKIFAEWYDGSAVQWDVVTVPKTNFRIQTGYYVGTGTDNLSITGVGFQPQLVLIKDDTANGTDGIDFKTSLMSGESTSKFADADADQATGAIKSLDADGFTLGTYADVNTANIRFHWIAFTGSDCTASGTFCIGSYTGTGVSGLQVTSVGFRPDLVIIKRAGGSTGMFRTTSMPDNTSYYFDNVLANTNGTHVRTLDATGFTVGNSSVVNTLNDTHWYIAFRNSSSFAIGTFTGDGTDDRAITTGFKPSAVFIKSANASAIQSAYFNTQESGGDYTSPTSDSANITGSIKSLTTTGFTVGTSATANDTGQTMYWFAFTGAVNRTASGSYKMAVGTYTGNGTSQSISGLGFAPDLVIVRDQSGANYAVFRTKLVKGDNTLYVTNALAMFAGGITSLDSTGFSVGADVTVNTNATVYSYQAFGNAWNPETGSGAADFAIGSFTGNGLTNRDIIRQPFQPDLIALRRSSVGGRFRTSSMTGNTSAAFSATADDTDSIIAITGEGFRLGTNSNANNAGSIFYTFSFKASQTLKIGTYVGTGSTQNITSPGIAPALVWVKGTDSAVGVYRPSTNVGDVTQNFTNSNTITGRITALLSNGFTVGTSTATNVNGLTYRYVVWKANTAPAIPTLVSPANSGTGVSVTPRLITYSTDAESDYLQYKIIVCTDVAMTTGCQTFNQVTSQTGWEGQNTQSTTAYTSGSQATYFVQTPLSANTTYYWQSYAIDPAGSNTFGSTQASPNSFTTGATPVRTEMNGVNMSGININ